jgi:glycine cleavage system H protein
MPEFLEKTFDKFTFRVATDRFYSSEGVWAFWVQPQEDNRMRVGLTDYLQQHSGDVAFVSIKPEGTILAPGEELAEIETIKMVLSLPAPVGGKVVEVNTALEMNPETVNKDPYGQGWLAVMEPTDWEGDRAKLLDAQSYFAVMQSQVEEELKER